MDSNFGYYVRSVDLDINIHPHFFVSKDFVQFQSSVFEKETLCFGVFNENDESPLATVVLAGKNGIWSSPITGAFGGISVKRGTHIKALDVLVSEIPKLIISAKGVGLQSITMRVPPECYPDDTALLSNVLYRGGWLLSDMDVNYHIPVSSVENYISKLGSTKQKQIKRLVRAGASFQESGYDCLDGVYDVIKKNRAHQGYPMTMSLDAIKELANHCSDGLKLFSLTLDNVIVASAICIRVDPKYLYVFYWGELPEYRSKSPVTLLSKGIVEYCEANRVEVLDIGTSSDSSIPNQGLCSFKSSLGCKVTQKQTFTWRKSNE
ncbi:hypothetical protein MADA3029_270078 [Vibrio nigripulchritudo MADA3029]|uniref:GNAT family N-acetyltransferase n=1 Tax=Vibrio nigripulchritudo TaxID=28173 RepID=UPI0003B210A7|nr:GNAT family N-acetyltransferase [Vibrio nigripulchritudo]CCN47642.1 hypothetical protein VIBNIMADA3020_420078 [Vibrio nigripulchritudo MADA3020]CCN56535.1 hypothetical protein VIBNIMADA3021_970030 [Vibrio nigripulchritudo MADA3021]CCN58841.1 hypothetical protein MADA3029_270078 [Vibrio nigripulchritudo MADA3029]